MVHEMEKLERSLGGIKDLGGVPDVVFVVDIGHEKNAVKEAQKLKLPLIGVVDSNHNPEGIDYVIPGNDDSIRAIGFYAREIANAILEAKAAAGPQDKDEAPSQRIIKKVEIKPQAATQAQTNDDEDKPADETTQKFSKAKLNTMKKAELLAYAQEQGINLKSSDTKAMVMEQLTTLN